MPEYLHPGVYVEEVDRGPQPIEGVPTSTAALLGTTERGQTRPRLVTSHRDYQRWFGDGFGANNFLPHTVHGFFENGGKRAYICRIVAQGATIAEAAFGDFTVQAAGPGAWGTRVFAKISPSTTKDRDGNSVGFRLQLAYWSGDATPFDPFTSEGRTKTPQPQITEDFDDLVTDESSPDFYGKRVPFVDLEKGETSQGPESSTLAVLVRNAGVAAHTPPALDAHPLAGGVDGATPEGLDDFTSVAIPGERSIQGLAALELDEYRDVSLVYAPNVSTDIARAIVTHCENLRYRFAVIDSAKGQADPTKLNPRQAIADSSHAAFYYPWIVTADPRTGDRTLIPPGGHVLGVYARTDTERGVFKAPANEIVRGALDLEFQIDDRTQDVLNSQSVNAIRSFPGRGIRVWGARTLTSNEQWKYVSVRRLFIFLEESVSEGTRWVALEPNDERLWRSVKDTIRSFLRTQWRQGALVGRTEEEAFFINCDRTTMTQDDIQNGRLICEIGVAPLRPAEFVILRLVQHTAEAQR